MKLAAQRWHVLGCVQFFCWLRAQSWAFAGRETPRRELGERLERRIIVADEKASELGGGPDGQRTPEVEL
jgi:hypothetical protein